MGVVEMAFAGEIFPIGVESSGTLGLIFCATGLGTGLAPLLVRRITGDDIMAMHWAILFTYIAMFVGYLVIGLAATLGILLLGTVVRTSGSGTNWVFSSSLLQMMVPGKYLGRVFAFDIAMMTLASSISTLAVGWAKDYLDLTPHQIALVLGTIPFITTIGWMVYVSRRSRRSHALST